MEAKEILQNESVMAGMFTIDSHLAYLLFDSSASHSFMRMGFVDRHNIPLMAIPYAYRIHTLGCIDVHQYLDEHSELGISHSHLPSLVHGAA